MRRRSLGARLLVLAGTAAFVGAVYAVVVLGGGALLGVAPPSLPLAVLATAIVAVTLEPVRRALGRLLQISAYDRLAAFGTRIAGTVATEQVGPRMVRLLAEATGARCVELWLVDDGGAEELSARWPPHAAAVDRTAPAAHVHDVVHAGDLLGRVVREQGPGNGLSPVEQRLTADLVDQAGLALRPVELTARLHRRIAESTERAAQLRTSRQRVVAAADAARARLERDIHDGAQQHLVALAVRLRLARTVAERDAGRAADLLSPLTGAADAALISLRELSQGIYPRVLADGGVAAALRTATTTSPVPVEVRDETSRRAAPEVEAAAYFSCLEAVQNAVKHAGAARITVRLTEAETGLGFAVHDDGRGLPAEPVAAGSGLTNMRDRVEAVGGILTVHGLPGTGTTVAGRIPAGRR